MKFKITILIILISFPILLILSNIKGVFYNCFHAYDLGLYLQAVYNITFFDSLNPYLTIRGLSIFNDHFMPILFMAVPFVKLSNNNPYSLVVFEWAIYLLFILLTLRLKKGSLSTSLLIMSFMIFSKGLLSGLTFPAHPGTWSIICWLLLIYFLKINNFLLITLTSLILCTFRESYPFCILGLSLYFLLKKNWGQFVILAILAQIYLFGVFFLRNKYLGPSADYGGSILRALIQNPFSYLIERFAVFDFKAFIKIYYPFVIPIFMIIKHERNKLLLPVLFLWSPLFLLHFLTNKFHFQYGPALVAPFLGLIVFSNVPSLLLKRPKLAFVTVLLFVLSSSSIYTKMVKNVFFNINSKCVMTKEKRSSFEKLDKFIKDISKDKTILSTGGVIPQILAPKMQIWPPRTFVKLLDQYDYLLLEKNGSGDTYPLSKEDVDNLRKDCLKYSSEVLLDDQFFFLMKGPLFKDCYLK